MGKGEETRQAILDQALQLASVEGLEPLSIGMLAQAVGMSKSGLFAHFKSKEQLQLAVLQETSARFVARVIAPALKQPRGEPRIRALFEGWMRWEKQEFRGGCVFRTAATELDDHPGVVRDYLVETQRDLVDTLTTIARAGIESGALRADLEPRCFAFELVSIFHGHHHYSRLLRASDAGDLARASFEDLLARSRA